MLPNGPSSAKPQSLESGTKIAAVSIPNMARSGHVNQSGCLNRCGSRIHAKP